MDMGLQNRAKAAGQTWPGASLRVADFFMALRWKKGIPSTQEQNFLFHKGTDSGALFRALCLGAQDADAGPFAQQGQEKAEGE